MLSLVPHAAAAFAFTLKLHIIINDRGEIISFVITQGNVDDRQPLSMESFIRNVSGKLYADRGYISEKLAETLFVDGIDFVAKMRNNMKGGELPLQDRVMIRKRAVIESVNDELKNICRVEHTRHRCFTNFITNPIAGLLAYSFCLRSFLSRLILLMKNNLCCSNFISTHVNLLFKISMRLTVNFFCFFISYA